MNPRATFVSSQNYAVTDHNGTKDYEAAFTSGKTGDLYGDGSPS